MTSSTSPPDPFHLGSNEQALLTLLEEAVHYAVERGDVMPVKTSDFPDPVCRHGATFVTVKKSGELRGCIGTLDARDPLVENIASNAHGAVARDPRFPTVDKSELPDMTASLSVLSPLTPIPFDSEDGLIAALRPFVDGLVIEGLGSRSTFLPQVWDSIPEPRQFLNTLKQKGGFTADLAPDSVKAWRYEVKDIGPVSLAGRR